MKIGDYDLEVVSLFPINIKLSLHAEAIAGDKGSKVPNGLEKGDRYIRKNFIGYYSDPALILRVMEQYEVAIAIQTAQNLSELRLALDIKGFEALDLRELRTEILDLRREQKIREQKEDEALRIQGNGPPGGSAPGRGKSQKETAERYLLPADKEELAKLPKEYGTLTKNPQFADLNADKDPESEDREPKQVGGAK